MGRLPNVPPPVFERRDAAAVIAFIRRNRGRLNDPRVEELPAAEFVDDEVVDEVARLREWLVVHERDHSVNAPLDDLTKVL